MLTALHYVRVGKRIYTPGEVVDAQMSEAEIRSLLMRRAVRQIAEDADEVIMPDVTPPAGMRAGADGTDAEKTEGNGMERQDAAEQDATEDADGPAGADEGDEPVIEIDAADAVVDAPAPEKTARTTSATKRSGKRGKA